MRLGTSVLAAHRRTQGAIAVGTVARAPQQGAQGMAASSLRVAFLALVAALSQATVASGQEIPLERAGLPPEVARAVVAFHNDSTTVRFTGRTGIPRPVSVSGNVSAMGGPFTVSGRLDGNLLVINGDLRLEPGARITGDVTVVGGRVVGAEAGMVDGIVTVFETPLSYTFRGDGIEPIDRGRRDGVSSPLGFGRSRLTVRAGRNYNRVEGLPVMFGPILETEARNPLRLEALAVWRTESGFDLRAEDLGYQVKLEQAIGGRDEVAVGVTARSEVLPLESWGLTDLEASMATFILHRDFRDYVQEDGWSAFLQWRPRRFPLTLGVEYREADHRFAEPGGPWSIRDNDQPWRPQPAVAEGTTRSLATALRLDTRNDPRAPTDGWLVDASLRQGLGGDLTLPALQWVAGGDIEGEETVDRPRTPAPTRYLHGFLDLRRYNRVGPTSSLGLRGLVAGSPGDEGLPPQLQHAAGGAGSVPGHSLFAVDCGARNVRTARNGGDAGSPAFPWYGCDRLVFLQAEFRSLLPLDLPRDTPLGNLLGLLELAPSWYLFADAARGWSASRDTDIPLPFRGEHSSWRSDVGVGLGLGNVGMQVAFPLQGTGTRATFTLRISPRF